jgi:hypothetical protein
MPSRRGTPNYSQAIQRAVVAIILCGAILFINTLIPLCIDSSPNFIISFQNSSICLCFAVIYNLVFPFPEGRQFTHFLKELTHFIDNYLSQK